MLEYQRLERCPICGKRGRGDEACRQREPDQGEAITNQIVAKVRMANAAIEIRDAPDGRPHIGELPQRALRRGDEQAMGNVCVCTKMWEEMCAALRMTPQHSLFEWDQARVGVEAHRQLPRRRAPYLGVVTTGGQIGLRPRPLNVEPWRNKDVRDDEGQGRYARRPERPANAAQ